MESTDAPLAGTQEYIGNPRNDHVLISVNGALAPRDEAKVSVFDSGFVLGDGVWEGLRLHDGRLAFLDKHFDRLWNGAKMLRIDIGLSREALRARLFAVIDANEMRDGVHIRLMVTRGVKRSPYQDPRLTIGKATIVIIPEWKVPRPEMLAKGLDLFTVHIRRTGPAEQDQKLNSHSKLNCILACIQAMEAGADEALMLDDRGFVATCNSTHFFIVRKGASLFALSAICTHRHCKLEAEADKTFYCPCHGSTFDPEGKVTDVKRVSGNGMLSSAAEDAVRKWRFEPGPGASTVELSLNFALTQ